MAPQFVTPYRQGGKNDNRDAEAICEAVGRARMRFVPVKSVEQQGLMAVHRARALVVGQRNAIGNQLRGLLAEFGIVVGRGVAQLRRALPEILEDGQNGLPGLARQTFAELWERLLALDQSKAAYDAQIRQLARASEPAQRLTEIEGVGEITGTAALATVGEAGVFRNGRQFAAWLGVTPRQRSSGERQRLGGITIWFWFGIQKHDKNIYLPCVGWMVLDSAVIIGVVIYRQVT
jgi:transposase